MGVPTITQIDIVNSTTIDVSASEAILQDANYYLPANWSITLGVEARTVSLVAGVSSTTTRLTMSPEMLTGETLIVIINASIVSLATAQSFNPAADSFLSVGRSPQVSSASATGTQTVRVTFDEPMAPNVALSDVASYDIDEDIGATPATVTLVTPEAVANPTYVDLTLAAEMTNGANYVVAVSTPGVTDAVGNALDVFFNTAAFAGVGIEPKLVSVEIFDAGRRVRLNFSEPMLRDTALTSVGNYQFNTVTAGATSIALLEVVAPETPTNPSYVDLTCSEMTIGASYEAEVSITGPVDPALNTIDVANNTVGFVGIGANPLISSIRAVSTNRVDLAFDEVMRDNADIRDPSRYTWDNGLSTLSILEVSSNVVKLVTSDQIPETLYTLTIDPV